MRINFASINDFCHNDERSTLISKTGNMNCDKKVSHEVDGLGGSSSTSQEDRRE